MRGACRVVAGCLIVGCLSGFLMWVFGVQCYAAVHVTPHPAAQVHRVVSGIEPLQPVGLLLLIYRYFHRPFSTHPLQVHRVVPGRY